MNKLEEAEKAFLKVRDYFLETQEDFALAKAYSKPWKWYREHTTDEAIEILRAEVSAKASGGVYRGSTPRLAFTRKGILFFRRIQNDLSERSTDRFSNHMQGKHLQR